MPVKKNGRFREFLKPETLLKAAGSDPYNALALGIVAKAIEDWRALDNVRYGSHGNYGELRAFFKSEWCDFLLIGLGGSVTGEGILKMLEDERRAAQ